MCAFVSDTGSGEQKVRRDGESIFGLIEPHFFFSFGFPLTAILAYFRKLRRPKRN